MDRLAFDADSSIQDLTSESKFPGKACTHFPPRIRSILNVHSRVRTWDLWPGWKMHSGFPLREGEGFFYLLLLLPTGMTLLHSMLFVLKPFIGYTSFRTPPSSAHPAACFPNLQCLLTTLTFMGIPPFGWKDVKCTPSFLPSTAVAMTTLCFHCLMIKIIPLYLLFRDGK